MRIEREELAQDFLDCSRHKLLGEYWPRTCECLDRLTAGQIWWRPNEASNSIGNLLLHLNGNVRQWIVSGLGGGSDERNRSAEFAERENIDPARLREALDGTLRDADAVLSRLTAADLAKRYRIQVYDEVTGLEAIYHVVEHFGMHHGQIAYITKLITSADLGFYSYLDKRTCNASAPE